MDLVGAYALACVNAFGGGTVRDLLLDNRPFYWAAHWGYLVAILALCVPFVYSAKFLRVAEAVHKRADKADGYHEAGAELAAIRFDRGQISEAVITMRKYTVNMPHSVEARCLFASMLLALDPKENPGAVQEAEFNLNIAEAITPNNPRVRETRGQLNRFKVAVAHGEPIPADIPMPRVTIAAEPKTGVAP